MSRSNLSFKAKLIGICVFMAIVPIIVGTVAFFGMKDVVGSYEKVTESVLPNVQYSSQMFLNYRRVRIELRTLGLPGITKEQADRAIKGVEEAIAQYEEYNTKYRSVPFLPGEKEVYDQVQSAWESFKVTGTDAIKFYNLGTPEAHAQLLSIFFNDCPTKAKIYTKAINELVEFHRKNGEIWVEDARKSNNQTGNIIWAVIVVGVVTSLAIGTVFAISISKSIQTVAGNLASGASQVTQAAQQISFSSQSLSEATTEQASSLEETVATMEELTAMVRQNTDNAKQAANLSSSTRDMAVKGEREIQILIESIQSISVDSKKIAEITSMIDDIAFQTNLLALNAAVEHFATTMAR